MAEFGNNFSYGDSYYKDEGGDSNNPVAVLAIEPVLLVTYENRAFYFSHRKRVIANKIGMNWMETNIKEYRLGEYLRYGQNNDEFIFGG